MGGDGLTYYKDRVSLVTDSYDNVDLFRLFDKQLIRYHFNRRNKRNIELTIALDVNKEYDVYIDENNTIYLAYQDLNYNIVLATIKNDKVDKIKLPATPRKEAYYLNLILHEGEVHILYFVPDMERGIAYKLYHHHLAEQDWTTNIVDEINVRELLNPLSLHKAEDKIIVAYLDYDLEEEHIYIKAFNTRERAWGEKIKLTDNKNNKLYLDLIYRANKIHLTYCQYEEGNLVVKYERFNYENGKVSKEIEETMSNLGSQQEPTLIYFADKLWLSWIEHDKVLSRYSYDEGSTWSPIYLWRESARSSIVRYKYSSWKKDEEVIFNYSFGKIKDDISFIGFGPLDNVEEVPIKKKIFRQFPKKIPGIN